MSKNSKNCTLNLFFIPKIMSTHHMRWHFCVFIF